MRRSMVRVVTRACFQESWATTYASTSLGPPSDEEAREGLTPHGEGSIVPYDLTVAGEALVARARLPIAGLEFQRRIVLRESALLIRETVTNVSGRDRAIGWTQHVTLGPPFLECGTTQFRASATRSKVFETTFGADDYLEPAAEFDWPMAPGRDGGIADLRVLSNTARSSAYTAHLMDQKQTTAYFVAFAPHLRTCVRIRLEPSDFPWLGIWEENHSRVNSPWNGRTLARGMEFGVSPMPETREAMIRREHPVRRPLLSPHFCRNDRLRSNIVRSAGGPTRFRKRGLTPFLLFSNAKRAGPCNLRA